VLLPARTACSDFLKGGGAMFKEMIDDAATACEAATATCPCVNGGTCEEDLAGGAGGASGHRRQLQGMRCACRPGFSGEVCQYATGSMAGAGCVTTLPLITATIEGMLNPGKWKAVLASAAALFGDLSTVGLGLGRTVALHHRAHPLHTISANIFGGSVSEKTM
jgi:hypothetical protein